MRLNGRGVLTLEDARTWLEETGLCLFQPRRQFSTFVAPSFVEAVAGEQNPAPPAKIVALAEELLIRLEADGVAVRLNLLGQPGEQPDFIVAAWVLPYVYALRGDRDWRRSPQLTGSRQVSPLAIQAYKHLEAGDATISQLRHTLGREVTESAVLRAITELWQQLRIIPVVSAPNKAAQWQLLRLRFQKAIAEGASTSQVTAISVLASIYLQAVIAASMEEVELFLAPLTARSKVREVLRGLVATRQVHTISLGHAPHFYVAGTLPDFAPPPTVYASSSMPASAYFLRSYEREDVVREPVASASMAAPAAPRNEKPGEPLQAPKDATSIDGKGKPAMARPHLSHPPARSHAHKTGQRNAGGRVARHTGRNVRTGGARTNGSSRHGHAARWVQGAANNGHSNGSPKPRKAKPTASRSLRNGYASASKAAGKPVSRRPGASRKDVRADKHVSRSSRKPALTASAKAGSRGRYGFTAPSKRSSKKRG